MNISTESIKQYINKKCNVETTDKNNKSIITGIILEYEPIDDFLIVDTEQGLGAIKGNSIRSISIAN